MWKAALALVMILTGGCSDTCSNSIVSTVSAPGGNLQAVLFQRDCGATTGFSSQVSVTNAASPPSGGGNAFVADDDHGKATAGSWGGPWVELRWLAPGHLLIRYDANARVFTQAQMILGVGITYEKVSR